MFRWDGDGDLASADAATVRALRAFEAIDDDEGIIRILLLRGWINGDLFELAGVTWSARWHSPSAPETGKPQRWRPAP
jgi:hypothetical protein